MLEQYPELAEDAKLAFESLTVPTPANPFSSEEWGVLGHKTLNTLGSSVLEHVIVPCARALFQQKLTEAHWT